MRWTAAPDCAYNEDTERIREGCYAAMAAIDAVDAVDEKPRTLFEKIWDAHIVRQEPGQPALL